MRPPERMTSDLAGLFAPGIRDLDACGGASTNDVQLDVADAVRDFRILAAQDPAIPGGSTRSRVVRWRVKRWAGRERYLMLENLGVAFAQLQRARNGTDRAMCRVARVRHVRAMKRWWRDTVRAQDVGDIVGRPVFERGGMPSTPHDGEQGR